MATPVSLDEIRRPPDAERIPLVEDIWNTIDEDTNVDCLSEAQRIEPDARLSRYKQGATTGQDREQIFTPKRAWTA